MIRVYRFIEFAREDMRHTTNTVSVTVTPQGGK